MDIAIIRCNLRGACRDNTDTWLRVNRSRLSGETPLVLSLRHPRRKPGIQTVAHHEVIHRKCGCHDSRFPPAARMTPASADCVDGYSMYACTRASTCRLRRLDANRWNIHQCSATRGRPYFLRGSGAFLFAVADVAFTAFLAALPNFSILKFSRSLGNARIKRASRSSTISGITLYALK